MAKGKIKRFDTEKGFGFIAREGKDDLFVHYFALRGGIVPKLNIGDEVEFDIGEQAVNVKVNKPVIHKRSSKS